MKPRIFGLSVLLAFVTFFLYCGSVWAGVRIDKPKVRLLIKPGSYTSDEIKVENTGNEAMDIRVYLEDWLYTKSDGSKDFFPKGSTALTCAPWITFYPADIKLEPGKSSMVRFTVNVPADAKGGHYCVMFFETGAGEIKEENSGDGTSAYIKVLNRVAALFYVEAEGTIDKKAELSRLEINQKLNDFIVRGILMNRGNTDITANSTFDVLDDNGLVRIRGTFADVFTLPGDKADLESVVSSKNLESGHYNMLITMDFENGGSLIQEADFSVGSQGEISDIHIK